jgi:hypothetical protein
MSYLSFENNIIEASGNLILKSTSGHIDCSGATIKNVTIEGTISGSEKIKVTSIEASLNDISFNNSNLLDVSSIQVNNDVSCNSLLVNTIGLVNHDISFNNSNLLDVSFIQVNNDVSCASLLVDTIGSTNHDISFNNSNLLDVSSIQVNNDVSCNSLFVNIISSNSDTININKNVIIDGSLVIQSGDTTLIHTKDLDISDNIIGLNRGNTRSMGKNTSGMLINYVDTSNIFFGYHNDPSINAFVIADTSYNHDDDSRNIVLDKYVNLKVGIVYCSDESRFATVFRSLYIQNDNQINFTSTNHTYGASVYGVQFNVLNGEHKCKGNIDVSGQVTANSFNAISDYRTKTNIEDLDENITASNLRPLVYLKNGQKEIGLLAHELQEVYPFMVCGEKDGKEMQSVNYIGLIGVLINDVKRLTNENQILKLNNDTLKSDYDTLKSENNDIKSRLDSLEEKFNKKFE